MRDDFLAYVAGLIDGEGHVSLTAKAKDRTGTYINPYLSIANTNRELIDGLGETFEGTGCYITYELGRKPQHKTRFSLTWRGEHAVEILTAVFPFLRIKSKQAEIVIDTWRMNSRALAGAKRFQSQRPLPQYVKELRRLAYWQLRDLNRRGVPVAA